MLKAHCLQPPSPVSSGKPQPGCEPLLRQWVATGSSNPALLPPIGPLCLSSTLSPGLKGRRDSYSFSLGGGGFNKCGSLILTTASFLVSKHRVKITHALSIFCAISWPTHFLEPPTRLIYCHFLQRSAKKIPGGFQISEKSDLPGGPAVIAYRLVNRAEFLTTGPKSANRCPRFPASLVFDSTPPVSRVGGATVLEEPPFVRPARV